MTEAFQPRNLTQAIAILRVQHKSLAARELIQLARSRWPQLAGKLSNTASAPPQSVVPASLDEALIRLARSHPHLSVRDRIRVARKNWPTLAGRTPQFATPPTRPAQPAPTKPESTPSKPEPAPTQNPPSQTQKRPSRWKPVVKNASTAPVVFNTSDTRWRRVTR